MKPIRHLIWLLILVGFSVQAEEFIESFHSDIEVRKNGDLLVTETILVKAEGRNIKRGIFRDFPTRYKNAQSGEHRVGFEILSVKRNGSEEPYFIKDRDNGKRVYIGSEAVFLPADFHQYEITYLSSRQLGFFEQHDELYWNVTGNGWVFRIDRASALVSLPGVVTDVELTGYTGKQGSTEQKLHFQRVADNQIYFQTDAPLERYEGLTIVAAWPKGVVAEPTAAQRRSWFFADHLSAIVLVSAAFLLLLYYFLVWLRVGKDPESGVIVATYQPPGGFSPASMRYVQNMGYDKKCFTSAVINLAAKGALVIDQLSKDFKIIKADSTTGEFAPGESQIMAKLFDSGREQIDIVQSNHRILSAAISKHQSSLKIDFKKLYFRTNYGYLLPGILLSLAAIAIAVINLGSEAQIARSIISSAAVLIPLLMVNAAIRGYLKRSKDGKIQLGVNVGILILLLAIVSFSEFSLVTTSALADWPFSLGVTALIFLNILFYHWLKAPTLAGRKLLDKIAGFKHYLEVAEEDEIALVDAPAFSSEIYEAYLPYAIALDLENQWTAKLNRAILNGSIRSTYIWPHWRHSDRHNGHLSKSLSDSFNSAISSSSVAPGSTSGSSGGSSGGGGGGGGGGGW